MSSEFRQNWRGFTILDLVVTVAVAGIVMAFAVPKIASSVQEFRLRSATNLMADLMARAKMQAVAQNTTCSVVIDTVGSQVGIMTWDASENPVRTDYVPLPSGISFGQPAGTIPGPMTGAPTASNVSFAGQTGHSGVYQQNFTSKGFPNVTAGTIHAIYITNGRSYGAVTLSCVGGIRLWVWDGSSWRGGHS
jgi:type II secretory pathway pseudopilin PulG